MAASGALADVDVLLDAGADKVSINSAAVRHPELIDELAYAFGNQFVVVAVDAKNVDGEWVSSTSMAAASKRSTNYSIG